MFTFLWGENIFFSKVVAFVHIYPEKYEKDIFHFFPIFLIGFFCLFCDI